MPKPGLAALADECARRLPGISQAVSCTAQTTPREILVPRQVVGEAAPPEEWHPVLDGHVSRQVSVRGKEQPPQGTQPLAELASGQRIRQRLE
jgi:hypothetical protein